MGPICLVHSAILLFLSMRISYVRSHGRLLEPPNRSSIWRFQEFAKYNPPANYDDNQLSCGGYKEQYEKNHGYCGICGDAYSDPVPRDNEDGGKYGRGIIVRNYTMGQTIPISVQLTMTHLGYFELRLCAKDDIPSHLEQSCYDQHLLELADGSGTKYPTGGPRTFNYSVNLPDGVTCSRCVIQWHYRTGNTWGHCGGDKYGIGCGPQETFRGCADVSIH